MTKILVVDDQEEVRALLAATLVKAKYQILTVGDGVLALEVAKQQKPDLIIMDVLMPGRINGLEATRILKSDPETSRCPIIILTGKDCKEDLRKGIEAGANSYFVKPFSPRQLIHKIEELLVDSQAVCSK
jgi:two-component system, OmpR family, phosphate regulon response regulator PhoB